VISGSAGLSKTGTGTLTLAAANTLADDVTVNAGTLLVTGTLPARLVEVAGSGAVLGGTGTFDAAVIDAGGILDLA
jgi:autotransporter-associated beta strand protein